MSDLYEREAQRRVDEACRLIRSAYRLHTLDPRETLLSVRTAISWGAEQQAADIDELVAAVRVEER
jgi:hypothetical protein